MTETSKKAPPHGWKPGQSGNLAGRAPRSGKVAKLRASIAGHIPALVAVLVERALCADFGASRLLLRRVIPPLRSIGKATPLALPDGALTEQGRVVLVLSLPATLAPGQGAALLASLGTLASFTETPTNCTDVSTRWKAETGHRDEHGDPAPHSSAGTFSFQIEIEDASVAVWPRSCAQLTGRKVVNVPSCKRCNVFNPALGEGCWAVIVVTAGGRNGGKGAFIMTFNKSMAVMALALGVAGAAQGADFYVGGGVGGSAFYEDDPEISVTDRQDVGFKVLGGIRFNPYLAVEAGWADLGEVEIAVPSDLGPIKAQVATEGWFIDVVGSYEVVPKWSVLGRIGLFDSKVKLGIDGIGSTSESDTGFKYGLGVQYELSKTLGLRAEWERAEIDVYETNGDGDLWSIGLIFRF